MIIDLKSQKWRFGKPHKTLQTQACTKCFLHKQKFGHGAEKMKKLSIVSSTSLDFTD